MIYSLATVENNVDKHGGGLIQVRLIEDKNKLSVELPWCMPILPKTLHIQPKINELVMVFANSKDELYGNHLRWFIGPIITQLNKLNFQDSRSARSFSLDGFFKPGSNPFFYTGSEGVYPESGKNDNEFGNTTGLLGRHNEDVILKDNEIWIRSGVHKRDGDALIFDKPSYIKQKNYVSSENPIIFRYDRINPITKNKTSTTSRTITTIVADEINFISSSENTSSNIINPKDLFDPNDMIDEKTMEKILSQCHRLPFGDVLIVFLSAFKHAFLNHVHIQGNAQNKPDITISGFSKEFIDVDFNKMISNNVRIN